MTRDHEDASAHDCDDCAPECLHPDHYYDGDGFTEEELAELYRRIAGGGPYLEWEEALRKLGVHEDELEGPVAL